MPHPPTEIPAAKKSRGWALPKIAQEPNLTTTTTPGQARQVLPPAKQPRPGLQRQEKESEEPAVPNPTLPSDREKSGEHTKDKPRRPAAFASWRL